LNSAGSKTCVMNSIPGILIEAVSAILLTNDVIDECINVLQCRETLVYQTDVKVSKAQQLLGNAMAVASSNERS
jgi:hypothetical protein